MAETPIYTLPDVSKRLKISIGTLREYVKRGELKAKTVGRAYYVIEDKLLAFVGGKEDL